MSGFIGLERVSKRFILRHEKTRSFQDAIVNFFHRRNGSTEEFWALKDVSLEATRGQALGIIGENGSGKSTILKLITRILEPTSGTIHVEGQMSALIELGAGFHQDLTGRENIYLNGSILGIGRKEMRRKIDSIIAFSELERFIDTPVKHYSSGMYARLGFSVAISVDPDILIIDEVLSVGDEGFQRKCLSQIDEFRRQGKTIIFVSHNLAAVESLCDRVIWLHGGVISGHGAAVPTIRAYLDELQRRDPLSHQSEHEAAAEQAEEPVRVARPEDDLVEITEPRLTGVDGQERYTFRTGESIVVDLRYRVADPTERHTIGLELRRADGLLVNSSECWPQDGWDLQPDGTGQVRLVIRELPLLAGGYELTVILALVGRPQASCYRSEPCSFSVWSEHDQTGIVALSHRSMQGAKQRAVV